jgi:hypothetical protein
MPPPPPLQPAATSANATTGSSTPIAIRGGGGRKSMSIRELTGGDAVESSTVSVSGPAPSVGTPAPSPRIARIDQVPFMDNPMHALRRSGSSSAVPSRSETPAALNGLAAAGGGGGGGVPSQSNQLGALVPEASTSAAAAGEASSGNLGIASVDATSPMKPTNDEPVITKKDSPSSMPIPPPIDMECVPWFEEKRLDDLSLPAMKSASFTGQLASSTTSTPSKKYYRKKLDGETPMSLLGSASNSNPSTPGGGNQSRANLPLTPGGGGAGGGGGAALIAALAKSTTFDACDEEQVHAILDVSRIDEELQIHLPQATTVTTVNLDDQFSKAVEEENNETETDSMPTTVEERSPMPAAANSVSENCEVPKENEEDDGAEGEGMEGDDVTTPFNSPSGNKDVTANANSSSKKKKKKSAGKKK